MAKTGNAYDKGRAAFWQGKPRKPTNDGAFMQDLSNVTDGKSKRSEIRKDKIEMITDWKSGWDDGHRESMENENNE